MVHLRMPLHTLYFYFYVKSIKYTPGRYVQFQILIATDLIFEYSLIIFKTICSFLYVPTVKPK